MKFSFNLKEQILIGVTLIVLVTVIFGVFIFKPQYDSFNEARSNQEKELQDQEAKKIELAGLQNDKKGAAVTEAKSLSLSKRMPEEADLPSVLVELDNLGNETNVKVLDITPSEAIPSSGFSTMPVELSVVGSYFNLADFTYKLVKLPREYTLGDISLEEAEQGYPLLKGSLRVNTYIYGADASQSSAAKGSTGSTGTSQTTSTQTGSQ